ncbi:unnamed protein product [Ostreobium quekettii]|uniref:Uncharacterized protein n=1 Tax=Ostreobium quekettii TaxID=121088 RepID=A0A8S1IM41_9CHLO|nr:unnamed protein product [Ostreobium quekettii]|eukprot:evm.model.scf_253EXC.3 EVM.evm.TU.scf_253EXC.3   scf_253EXC:10202-12099(+)
MGLGSWGIALFGYLFTYYHTKLTDERKVTIDRVNEQLRDFYGPLLACVTASKSAYDAMVRQHSPDGTVVGFQRAVTNDPGGKEGHIYRQWMTDVLQPLNERAAAIIFDHVDLLDTSRIEPLLLQLVAHVSAYKVILSRWKKGEISGEVSVISYPDRLVDYIRTEFGRLKRLQSHLIGRRARL